MAYNYHRWCLTNNTFKQLGLDQLFNAIAVAQGKQGQEYISVIESKKYPIYGVQFHPEKPQFEFLIKAGHRK